MRPVRRLASIYLLIAAVLAAAVGLAVYGYFYSSELSNRERQVVMDVMRELAEEKVIGIESEVIKADLALFYSAAEVFVLPSWYEGFGLPVLEAMACGAFPVVADIAANREWIDDGKNGLLFPAGSSDALAEKILNCLDREVVFRASAREINARMINERARWSSNIEKLLGLCEQVMSR